MSLIIKLCWCNIHLLFEYCCLNPTTKPSVEHASPKLVDIMLCPTWIINHKPCTAIGVALCIIPITGGGSSKILRGTGTKIWGLRGGYPLKNSSVLAHLFNADGEFCYFSLFFFSFYIFFSPLFLPPWNFRRGDVPLLLPPKDLPIVLKLDGLCRSPVEVRLV